MFTLFITATHLDPAAAPDMDRVGFVVGGVPGLSHALIYTPAAAHDPYLDDGPPPALALQLYFADIADLESACARDGALQRLPPFHGADITQQAMLARKYPVPEPAPDLACTYLVAYTGAAEDMNAWLSHYIDHHVPLMRRFPAIRGIEICTRIDYCSFLSFRRVEYMQRNKNVFDSPEALNAAINSPVRHEMRADFHKFPAFSGPTLHYPMLTRTVLPARSA